TTYTVPVFNPLALRNEPLTVKVDGRAALDGVDAIVLTEEQHDLRARVWLTPDGSVLREEGSLGLTLVRESREAALAGDAALVPLDLVSASRIPVAGRIEDPRHVSRLTLRMQGAAAARVPLDPPRQRVRGDLLRVEREPLPEHAPLGAADAALAQYLAPAPFIESDDAAIVAAARAIVGSERDATAAAHALVAWVNEHLEQAPSVTVPSAREVLAARRGDCNEHAVLLAALARAAGIPARVVAGSVFGFVGPNGAGKPPAVRLVPGLLAPTAGTVLLGGHDIGREPEAAKAITGYLPDHPFLYDKLTALEFLRFVGGLYELGG